LAAIIENANAGQAGDLKVLLIQQVEANRNDLVSRYNQSLRATLFTDRAEVHPSILKRVAAEEVDALLQFLRSPSDSGLERGGQLCQAGLSEKSVLRLNQVSRQFFIAHLEDRLIAPTLDLLDIYQHALIQGFMQSRERVILDEQDRIRKAFELTIRRYTVEIKEIQVLAQRATEANNSNRASLHGSAMNCAPHWVRYWVCLKCCSTPSMAL
jgi:hypothetical protein